MNTKQKRSKTKKLITEYGSVCWWCGSNLLREQVTIDHLRPKSKGGSHNLENLRIACKSCNEKRRDSLFPPGFSAHSLS